MSKKEIYSFYQKIKIYGHQSGKFDIPWHQEIDMSHLTFGLLSYAEAATNC
ncbi:hypothetical protein [Floridanema evergladense]|uniref:Uncharacterized protein n=1 Tax=Floridaenema evergladense BLCC-F167 TaxID=3153639 RepID=A0ABV4WD61_9CYAN